MFTSRLTRRSVICAMSVLPVLARKASFAAEALPKMLVTKDPTCGCCSGWTDHIRAAGFPVEVIETADLNGVKARLGVPRELASCHTAEVAGFVVEGHVPASVVKRLLDQKPDARGLAVPGMPVGSPGMEVKGEDPDLYDAILFGPAGQRVFARYQGEQEVPLSSEPNRL
jgi:hypothetical protein